MGVPDRQHTILDILYSREIEEWCYTSPPAHKSRERTLQILTYILKMLVSEGNCIHALCEEDGPAVSIDAYLTRFFKYTPCKKDIFISSLVYLDRMIKHCGLVVNSTNVHRQYLICNLMAAKLFEESAHEFPVNNRLFAIVGGVPLSEMNDMEVDFLSALNYRLHIFPEEFSQYARALRSRLSLLKDLYNAQHGSLEEINSTTSTYYIYKQFTESIINMEKTAVCNSTSNTNYTNPAPVSCNSKKSIIIDTSDTSDPDKTRRKKRRGHRKKRSTDAVLNSGERNCIVGNV